MQMKKTGFAMIGGACAAIIGAAATPAMGIVSYDEDLTPNFIGASGVDNGFFTVDRDNGVEIGIRGKLRFNSSNQAENTFNSNGDGTYSFAAGQAPGGFSFSQPPTTTPVWSFDWGVNSDWDGSSGWNLDDLTYEMGLDFDPGPGTNFQVFDPITGVNPGLGIVQWDHAIGDNSTSQGGGTVIPNNVNDPTGYATLLANNNVAQNSWNYEFFNEPPYDFFDPNIVGAYDIYLKAFDGATEVASITITILVTTDTKIIVVPTSDWCSSVDVNDPVSVDLNLQDAQEDVAGASFLIAYNADKLQYDSTIAGDAPFDFLFYANTNPLGTNDGVGTEHVLVAVGDLAVPPSSTSADTRMATVNFTVLDEFCAESDLVVLEAGTQPIWTRLTNESAETVPHTPVNLEAQTVDDTPPDISVPADIVANADAGGCDAVVDFPTPVVTDNCSSDYASYLESFETTDYLSSASWNEYNSTINRVASGTNGIASSDGSFHAVIDSTILPPAPDDSTGAYSRLGGYSSEFGNGFVTSIDIYIDLSDPTVAADTYGWDLSTAATNQSGAHLQDFIFHTASNASGNVLVGASNNTNFTRRNDLASINHYEITSSGWYTFEWVFREKIDGTLAVDLQLVDAGGSVLWVETRNDPGNVIATVVGGNRYMWFTFLEVDTLAIDNTQMNRGSGSGAPITVDVSPPSGSVFPGGTTTVTITATDSCGNMSVETFDVTVTSVSDMDVEVALIGVEPDTFERCITFTLWDCDTGTSVVHQENMEFTGGTTGVVTIEIPCGPWDCITAQDELHTLIATDQDDFGVVGTQFVADFTGGDALIGGNVNSDGWIDILDFGGYVGQYGVFYDGVGGTTTAGFEDGDTLCGDYSPIHADFSGNGTVGTEDFTFISNNFLLGDDDSCCTLSAPVAGGPIESITVAELHRRGLHRAALADLNGDGVLDMYDVVAFMNGDRPTTGFQSKPSATGDSPLKAR